VLSFSCNNGGLMATLYVENLMLLLMIILKKTGLEVGSPTRQTLLLLIIRNIHDIIKQPCTELWVIWVHSWILTQAFYIVIYVVHIWWLKNQHTILINRYLLVSQKQILLEYCVHMCYTLYLNRSVDMFLISATTTYFQSISLFTCMSV
jgi:hypothetical protein